MSKKQELIDRVLNDLDNNWVVSKQDILSLIDYLTEAQVDTPKLAKHIRVSKEDAGNKELIDHIIQHKRIIVYNQ